MNETPVAVTRTFSLAAPAGAAARALADDPAVSEVRVESGGRRLRVTYDLRHLRFEDVERRLEELGAPAATGLAAGLRRNWAHFQETNLIDQANIVHQCCSNPPTKGQH